MSEEITPFRIEIPEADLDDLRRRLRQTRWPEPATADDWSQGIPLAYLRELCDYWLERYDWRSSKRGSIAFRSSGQKSTGSASISFTSDLGVTTRSPGDHARLARWLGDARPLRDRRHRDSSGCSSSMTSVWPSHE